MDPSKGELCVLFSTVKIGMFLVEERHDGYGDGCLHADLTFKITSESVPFLVRRAALKPLAAATPCAAPPSPSVQPSTPGAGGTIAPAPDSGSKAAAGGAVGGPSEVWIRDTGWEGYGRHLRRT